MNLNLVLLVVIVGFIVLAALVAQVWMFSRIRHLPPLPPGERHLPSPPPPPGWTPLRKETAPRVFERVAGKVIETSGADQAAVAAVKASYQLPGTVDDLPLLRCDLACACPTGHVTVVRIGVMAPTRQDTSAVADFLPTARLRMPCATCGKPAKVTGRTVVWEGTTRKWDGVT